MRPGDRLRRGIVLLCYAVILSALACRAADNLVGQPRMPVLYLAVSVEPDSVGPGTAVDSSLYAFLGRTVVAADYEYLTASEFRLTRRSDGASFGWLPVARQGAVTLLGFDTHMRDVANFRLPWSTGAAGLGRSALTPGDTYDLNVVADGITIRGSTVLPATPVPNIEVLPSGRVVRWPKSPWAAGFELRIDTDAPGRVLTLDTAYVIKNNGFPQANPEFRVRALDGNMWQFLSDSAVSAAGLVGAWGFFGSVAKAAVSLR